MDAFTTYVCIIAIACGGAVGWLFVALLQERRKRVKAEALLRECQHRGRPLDMSEMHRHRSFVLGMMDNPDAVSIPVFNGAIWLQRDATGGWRAFKAYEGAA